MKTTTDATIIVIFTVVIMVIYFMFYFSDIYQEHQEILIQEYETNLIQSMQEMNNDYVENMEKIKYPTNLTVVIKEK